MSLTAWPLAGDEAIERDEEERLIEHAKSDREARGDLYRQHYSTVYRFVHRRVGNRHDADDIVSDVGAAMDAGMTGVLVRTGKFRPRDLDGPIRPHVLVDSIRDLVVG